MAIKLEDVFACINKSAEANQDPGAQAMAAAAQAATPPGGIPLPKPIEQPTEEGGENMVPEEKLQAEKEKLEAQRRAELEKKENEIRGLQHELDLERVERQKATAENELKEKSRQQEEKLRQEREKLDAERQKLERDKAMQSNTQQAELIKHQADMERETSKQVADIAQQKAKAIEDIAKQNAQQYIKTTQQSQQQANRYFADQQKRFKSENPVMSTALQNQINSAVSASKSVTNHHRKIASYLPIPGSAPMEKKASLYDEDDSEPYAADAPGAVTHDRTLDIENYSPANQARYIATEIAQINQIIAQDPSQAAKYKPYLAKLDKTLKDIDTYVNENRNSGAINKKDLASYDLLTQKKTRTGRVGYSTIDNRYKDEGLWGHVKRWRDYINESLDNSSVELSDLDMIRQNGQLGTAEANKENDWRERWLGLGRAVEDSVAGRVGDTVLGGVLGGAVGGIASGIGRLTGIDSVKDFGDNLLSAAGSAFKGDTRGTITSGLIGDFTKMVNLPGYVKDTYDYYQNHARGNEIIDKYGLKGADADALREEYDISANPGWNTVGRVGMDALNFIPVAAAPGRIANIAGKMATRVGKAAGKASGFGTAMRRGGAGIRRAVRPLRPLNKLDNYTGQIWTMPAQGYLEGKLGDPYNWNTQAEGARLAQRTNDHLRQWNKNPGDLRGDELTHFVNTYQTGARNGYRGASGALGYFKDDIRAKQPSQYGSMFKSSAARLPIPGSIPMEKKSSIDDDLLEHTATGRNIGYSPNQLFSSTYVYSPFKQNWFMEKIEEFLPTISMITGGAFNFDYDLSPVFGKKRAPLDAAQLSSVIYDTDTDPLLKPKKEGANSPLSRSLKDALKRKYGYERRQYTTIPTRDSNAFAIPKTN